VRAVAFLVFASATAFADADEEPCPRRFYAEPSLFLIANSSSTGDRGGEAGVFTRLALGYTFSACDTVDLGLRFGVAAQTSSGEAGKPGLGFEAEINTPLGDSLRIGGRLGYAFGEQDSHQVMGGARIRFGDVAFVGVDGFFQHSELGNIGGAMVGGGLDGKPGWITASVEVAVVLVLGLAYAASPTH
jgi:hypothetical protein